MTRLYRLLLLAGREAGEVVDDDQLVDPPLAAEDRHGVVPGKAGDHEDHDAEQRRADGVARGGDEPASAGRGGVDEPPAGERPSARVRALAPVPWIDHVVATRLWERLGGVDPEAVAGTRIVALDPRLELSTGRRLIGSGAVADRIIVRDGDDVVLVGFDTQPAKVDNLARLPMAWVDPAAADQRVVLGSGPQAVTEYVRALDEWRVLTAAALAGLVEQTMTIAAEFAKSRYTLGVPISTLQAISHPLANMAIVVQGGRGLSRRAAWFLDNEPDERPELAGCAFVFMSEEAAKAATMAVHIQGGLGVSAEAAATAYLIRARGWPLAGGDPGITAKHVAELVAAREAAE